MTPKPANASRPSVSDEAPLQIVHISDIHVDRFYETGASYNCTKNICCRPYTSADAPGNTSYPAGEYGNVKCDSPVTLEQSMYTAVESLVPNRTFTLVRVRVRTCNIVLLIILASLPVMLSKARSGL